MEKNAAITLTNNQLQHDHVELPKHPRRKKKKGAMHVIRVALFMMRGGRSKKSSVLPVDDGSKSIWRKLVGSMRPLHIHGSQSQKSISADSSPPNTTTALPQASLSPLKGKSNSYMNSPAEEEPYTPSPPSTRYASAVGLNELVQSSDDDCEKQQEMIVEDEDDDENEEYFDGDEEIDDKAEEFIAQFYQQMKMQRLDSVDRRYNERSERSLGM